MSDSGASLTFVLTVRQPRLIRLWIGPLSGAQVVFLRYEVDESPFLIRKE